MRKLNRSQVDNIICNIENADGEDVRYDPYYKRFVFETKSFSKGGGRATVAINQKEFSYALASSRFAPSESLSQIIFNLPWFLIPN